MTSTARPECRCTRYHNGIAVEPTALDAHHAALDLVARHAAIGVQLGLPVVSVMRPALMVPQPLQTMPAGLATITCALPPATSIKPRSWLGLLLLTSLRMTRAGAELGLRLGYPDHPGHLGRGHHRRVVEDGAFGVDVELLILIM